MLISSLKPGETSEFKTDAVGECEENGNVRHDDEKSTSVMRKVCLLCFWLDVFL